MAAHAVLKDQAKVGDATNNLFWLDPWSKDGQKIAAQMRPYTHDLRMHAEAALTLIAQARAVAGPNPSSSGADFAEWHGGRLDLDTLRRSQVRRGNQRSARTGRNRRHGAGRATDGLHRPEIPACRRDGSRLRPRSG